MYSEKSRIQTKEWRTKNRERFNAYMRDYYSTEEQKAKKREYHKKNIVVIRAYQKEYWKKYGKENRARLTEKRKEWAKNRKIQPKPLPDV